MGGGGGAIVYLPTKVKILPINYLAKYVSTGEGMVKFGLTNNVEIDYKICHFADKVVSGGLTPPTPPHPSNGLERKRTFELKSAFIYNFHCLFQITLFITLFEYTSLLYRILEGLNILNILHLSLASF
jgi:hypothetical protein